MLDVRASKISAVISNASVNHNAFHSLDVVPNLIDAQETALECWVGDTPFDFINKQAETFSPYHVLSINGG